MAKPGWEQTTAYKNNRQRFKHRRNTVLSAAGAGGVAAAGANITQGKVIDHTNIAASNSDSGEHHERMSDQKMHGARKYFDAANRDRRSGGKEGGYLFDQAKGLAGEAGGHKAQAAQSFRDAGKSLDRAKNWKRGGFAATGIATTGLLANAVHQKREIARVRPKQLARDKAANLSKRSNISAFGIEH